MIGTVYAHINRVNEKVYVGQTWDLKRRWDRTAYKGCKLFNRALDKYGWDGFDHVILLQREIAQEELNAFECLWIAILNSNNPKFGYNMTAGGEGVRGLVVSEETREKMRQAGIERGFHPNCRAAQREYMKNRVVSPETREKLRASKIGKPLSDEHKQALRESRKYIPMTCAGWNRGLTLGPRTEEVKEKIRQKLIGHPSWAKPHTEEAKEKIRAAAKNRRPHPQSEETKQAIREKLKGRKRPPELMARIVATRKKNKQNGTNSHDGQPAESFGRE